MPIKLTNKSPTDSAEARIEIIPLIDIMFFLLAAFMLVSLSLVNQKSVNVNLPTAVTAQPDQKKDFLDISIDSTGGVFLDKTPITLHELIAALVSAKTANPEIRVFISGDKDARHGQIIAVLDAIRSAGIDKVAFDIQSQPETQP